MRRKYHCRPCNAARSSNLVAKQASSPLNRRVRTLQPMLAACCAQTNTLGYGTTVYQASYYFIGHFSRYLPPGVLASWF